MFKKFKILLRDLTTPMPLSNNFSDYDEYWESRGFDAPSMKRAKIMEPYIDKNKKILDIGCGEGTVMNFLRENKSPKKLVGVDISDRAIQYVKKRKLEAYVFDVQSGEFGKYISKKKFDYVIITEVLEHVQNPEDLILSIRDSVNDKVIVSIPNSGFFVHRLRLMFGKFPIVVIVEHVKEHIRFWTKKDFYYWAEYHGFSVEKTLVTSGMGITLLKPLEKYLPGLFAKQLMYILRKK